jgi:transcriptional regulator with XRE-family HTH domain
MKRIYAAMEMKKISIAEMCEQAGIGEATFWRYKTGKTMPPIDLIIEMSRIIGVSFEELVKGIAPNPPQPPTPDEQKPSPESGEKMMAEPKSAA